MNEAHQRAIQSMVYNEPKVKIRKIISEICIDFLKTTQQPLQYIGLPANDWLIEKRLLSECTENNIPVKHIVGCNNKDIVITRNNMIEHSYSANEDINDLILSSSGIDMYKYKGEDLSGHTFQSAMKVKFGSTCHNVVCADYCGYICKFHTAVYATHPEVKLFVEFARQTVNDKKSAVYFLTFKCNGVGRSVGRSDRQVYGEKEDIVYMMQLFGQSLRSAGIKKNVKLIMRVKYNSENGKSKMITFGFAINYAPTIQHVKKDWSTYVKDLIACGEHVPKNPVNPSQTEETHKPLFVRVGNDHTLTDEIRSIVKACYGMGWSTNKIATTLGLKTMQVGSIKAWMTMKNETGKEV